MPSPKTNPKKPTPVDTTENPYYVLIMAHFPDFRFKSGKKFAYHPPKTIVMGPPEPRSELLLLHEVSHATLHHSSYLTDVERLRIESEAWDHARTLADELKIPFDTDFAESHLDSYRDWLHNRSLCPHCHITRYQTPDGHYHCPSCDHINI